MLSSGHTDEAIRKAIFVPDDETCFYVFESSSKEAVLAATERAAFAFPRIAEAVS